MSNTLDLTELVDEETLRRAILDSQKKIVMFVFSESVDLGSVLKGMEECGSKVIFYGSGIIPGSDFKARIIVAKLNPDNYLFVEKVINKVEGSIFGAVGIDTMYDYIVVEECLAKCINERKKR